MVAMMKDSVMEMIRTMYHLKEFVMNQMKKKRIEEMMASLQTQAFLMLQVRMKVTRHVDENLLSTSTGAKGTGK